MLEPEESSQMVRQKKNQQKEGQELSVQGSRFQGKMQVAVGDRPPCPISRTESLILRRGQLTNRSFNRWKRSSAKWVPGGEDPPFLSGTWGSTRRKGLKELFLQSSSATPTWLRESLSVDLRPEQNNSEELSLALDPLEHEWMLTVAEGDAESIVNLLAKDSTLLSRRDFVTGFTVLHWLAKHGHHEDLIQVIAFAEKNGYPLDINGFTARGRLTPLHLAALQGHEMVIKVLVGAYGANTSLRDHNGRKAWQYLPAHTSRALKELLGVTEEDLKSLAAGNVNNNCAPSRWGGIKAFRMEDQEAGAEGPSQRNRPRGSYFRNMFRQALAFFQEL